MRVAAFCVILVAACGDDLKPPPVEYEGHGIHVTLPGGAETRDATPRMEQQSGSYKFEDDRTTPWRAAGTFQNVRVDGDVIQLALAGDDGERLGYATLTIAEVAGASAGAGAQVEMSFDFSAGGPSNRAASSYLCVEGEHFLGLGGQSWDVDHRGHTVRCGSRRTASPSATTTRTTA